MAGLWGFAYPVSHLALVSAERLESALAPLAVAVIFAVGWMLAAMTYASACRRARRLAIGVGLYLVTWLALG